MEFYISINSEDGPLHVFIQSLHYGQDATQRQFLSEVQLVWIQNFPFSKLVA